MQLGTDFLWKLTSFITQIKTSYTDLILFSAVKSRRTVRKSVAPLRGLSHAVGRTQLLRARLQPKQFWGPMSLLRVPPASLKVIPVSWVGKEFTLLKRACAFGREESRIYGKCNPAFLPLVKLSHRDQVGVFFFPPSFSLSPPRKQSSVECLCSV